MPQLLSHCSTISLTWSISNLTQSFRPVAYVALCRPPPPHRMITTTSGGNCSRGRRSIICMANPRRVKMVSKQIQRELSDMLLTDKVLQYAVLPEAALGADRYLSSLTTISDVEVSADLQVVKVYVSVFGDERGKEVALAGLKSKAKYVRSELGKRMKLRLTPEVIAILDKLKDENKKMVNEDGDDDIGEVADGSNDDVEWEGDDVDDEDIIYVK
ncbi:hypothetical protein ACS0TY_003943 [Phlomoides rotata]